MPVLLSLGHGYVARRLARGLVAEGWRVLGTTRDGGRAAEIAAEGAEPLAWPLADPEGALDAATHVLSSVAPGPEGDPVLAALGAGLAARAGRLEWVGYLSTTGVYGDRAGGWVDEGSELRPAGPRGAARVAAEAGWLGLWRDHGVPVEVFRLAGIYGPGRGPFAGLRAGTARRIVKPGQVFSRIHVDDIVAVLRAAMARPRPGTAWNVCDDDPAPPQEVVAEAARLIGVAPPPEEPFETAEMTPMARSFYAESKRVSNRRIREELGVRLRYPSYREGLRAVLAEEGGA